MNAKPWLAGGVLGVAGILTFIRSTQVPPTPSSAIPPSHRAAVAALDINAEPSPADLVREPVKLAPAPTQEEVSRDLLRRLQAEIERGGDPDNDATFRQLLADLMANDPVAAARFACSFAPGQLRSATMHAVAQVWTMADPQGVVDWASRLPDPDERTLMLSVICYQIAEADPALAIESATRLDLKEQRYGIEANLAEQWAARDFSAASAWALRQPVGAQRDQMLQRMILVQAQTKPEDAGTLVAEQMPPGPAQDEAAVTVVTQWAKIDLARASAWVASFPPGLLQQRAETQLAILAGDQKP